MSSDEKSVRVKPIPEFKKEKVSQLVEKMKSSKTVLIASIKGLPASQFQSIKCKLRGKADILVAKKSAVSLALVESGKGSLVRLKDLVGADVALIFSDLDAFEVAGLLVDSQSAAKAKVGDIAPEDIEVEAGPTDLMPGPAISELGAVGLKVAVENGKLAIKEGKQIAKKGDVIDTKISNVLGKLKINPMQVGFIPVAAYDSEADTVYEEIKIDKKGTLEALKEAIGKSLGFAVNLGYATEQTVKFFIARAGLEEKALSAKLSSGASEETSSEVSEEKKEVPEEGEKKDETTEEKVEEKKDE